MTLLKSIIAFFSCSVGILTLIFAQFNMIAVTILGWILISICFVSFISIWVVHVEEHRYAIVRNRRKREFSGYLEHGLHLLRPFEKIDYELNRVRKHVKGRTLRVLSHDGIPHEVSFDIMLETNLDRIAPNELSGKLHYLNNSPNNNIAKAFVEDAIRELFGKLSAEQICDGISVAQLKRQMRDHLQPNLHEYGFDILKCFLKVVDPPQDFTHTLVQAQARDIETRIATAVIQALGSALSKLSSEEKAYITELESLDRLSRRRGSEIYFNTNRAQPPTQQSRNALDWLRPRPTDPFSPNLPFIPQGGGVAGQGASA